MTPQNRAKLHLIVSALLYYTLTVLSFGFVATAIVLPAGYLSGIWAWVGGFAGFCIAGTLAGAGWAWIRRKRSDRFYRLHFPDYRGEQFYAGSLRAAQAGGVTVGPERSHYKIADGGDALFLVGTDRREDPHEAIGGKMLAAPGGAPLRIAKAAVRGVSVLEFDDAAIKASTQSTDAERAERAMTQGIMWMVGRKVTHTITPYAAMVFLDYDDAGTPASAVWAVRTDVPAGAMRAMGTADSSDIDALVAAAAKKAVGKVEDEITDELHDLMREKTAEYLGDHVLSAADTLASVHGDLAALASLGDARIGPTDGARVRLYARLVAERLRAMNDLPSVEILRAAS